MNSGEDQAAADIDAATGDSHEESHDSDSFGATDLKGYQEEVERLTRPQEESADDDDGSSDESEDHEEQDQEDESSESEESESDNTEADEGEGEDEDESEEEDGDADQGDDEEEEEADDRPTRFRVQTKDPVEAEALALRKRHRDWSLEKCITKAKEVLGVSDAAGDEESDTQEESEPARTVSQARDELKDLRRKRNEALKSVELDTAADLNDQIDALQDEIEELRVTESSREQKKVEQLQTVRQKSEVKSVRYYPDAAKPDSALVQEMHRIHGLLQETGDERVSDPDYPFMLTKMAAKSAGIAPVDPSTPAAKKKSAGKVVRRPAHQPASGSRRSTSPTAPSSKADEAIEGIGSLDDYEQFVGSYGG